MTSFTITTGVSYLLIIIVQPGNVVPGQAFSISVGAQDAGGNSWKAALGQPEPHITARLDREDMSLNSPILSGPLCTGSSGICVQQMYGSVAILSGLVVDKAPAVYRLKLTGSLVGISLETFSDIFYVAIGNLGELRCFRQPDDMLSGTAMRSVVVRLHDSGGNFLHEENSLQVELEIVRGSGVLNGTTVVSSTGGQAIFGAVNISLLTTSVENHIHVLRFRAGVKTLVSNPFTVTFGAAKARFATFPPKSFIVGQVFFVDPEIACLDVNNNLVASSQTAFTASATILNARNIFSGITLTGTTTVKFFRGIATFTDLVLIVPATVYTLSFSTSFTGSNVLLTWNVTGLPGAPTFLQIVEGYAPGAPGGVVQAGNVLPRQP